MRKTCSLYLLLSCLIFVACSVEVKTENEGTYGETFSDSAALSLAELQQQMLSQNELEAVVSGKVTAVCKSEGCWLTLENPGGEDFFIDIKDKSFHLPADVEGKTVTVKGKVLKEKLSVEDQKEAARQEDRPAAEIEAITTEKEELSMEASGVHIH